MADSTNYYVDPVGGNDSTGDGLSDATAWKTTQKALDTITRNSTSGDRINIKAGGADVLSSALSFTSFGGPSTGAPAIFQGYTSVTGDGGMGDIDGGGNSINIDGKNGVYFIDMKLHNTGSNMIHTGGAFASFLRCELYDSDSKGLILGSQSNCVGCYFHDITGIGVTLSTSNCLFCHFKDGSTQKFGAVAAVACTSGGVVAFCTFDLQESEGVVLTQGSVCMYCSAFSSAGASSFVGINAGSNSGSYVWGCYAEGFLQNIGQQAGTTRSALINNNAAFNGSSNDFNIQGDVVLALGENNVLAASGLTDRAGGDWTPTTADKMRGNGYLNTLKGLAGTTGSLDVGAIQAVIPAGGGFFGSGLPLGF